MLTVLVPPSATDLTTLAAVKDELGLAGSDADAVLSRMIAQASAVITRYCDRPFPVATYQETVRGYGDLYLQVSRTPVVAVSTVLYQSEPLTDAVIADADAGQLFREHGWFWTAGWRADLSQMRVPGSEQPTYTITYQAGYRVPGGTEPAPVPALPGDLERAAIDTVKAWWEGRSGVLIASKRVADLSITYNQIGLGELPPGVQTTLMPWRRWV